MEEESGVGEMLRMSYQTMFAAIFMLLSTALPAFADIAVLHPGYMLYAKPPIFAYAIILSGAAVSIVLYIVCFICFGGKTLCW